MVKRNKKMVEESIAPKNGRNGYAGREACHDLNRLIRFDVELDPVKVIGSFDPFLYTADLVRFARCYVC